MHHSTVIDARASGIEENVKMDYHDYVIKEGKFIGRFEEMYENCPDPWLQSEEIHRSYSRWDTVRTINRCSVERVLEIGCGLGFFTQLLTEMLPQVNVTGMDISETAILRARKLHPEASFLVGGVETLVKTETIHSYDCLIFSEIMWYILNDMKEILQILRNKWCGLIIVNQVFYFGTQKYGREYFTNQEEMVAFFNLKPIVKNIYQIDSNEISYETHTAFKICSK